MIPARRIRETIQENIRQEQLKKEVLTILSNIELYFESEEKRIAFHKDLRNVEIQGEDGVIFEFVHGDVFLRNKDLNRELFSVHGRQLPDYGRMKHKTKAKKQDLLQVVRTVYSKMQ